MVTRRVYSADVKVWATLYVIAKNEKEARRMMRAQLGCFIEAGTTDDFDGRDFSDPDLPDVHFSPSMTVEPRQRLNVGLAEECEVDDDEDEG